METIQRSNDLQPLAGNCFTISVNGRHVPVAEGESLFGVLAAAGLAGFSRNDHGHISGAYCGMGVCHCCTVKVDSAHKRRACQTIVRPGMRVETGVNRMDEGGLE